MNGGGSSSTPPERSEFRAARRSESEQGRARLAGGFLSPVPFRVLLRFFLWTAKERNEVPQWNPLKNRNMSGMLMDSYTKHEIMRQARSAHENYKHPMPMRRLSIHPSKLVALNSAPHTNDAPPVILPMTHFPLHSLFQFFFRHVERLSDHGDSGDEFFCIFLCRMGQDIF